MRAANFVIALTFASNIYAGIIGNPVPSVCKNTSTGQYLNSFTVEKIGAQSKIRVVSEKGITEYAKKLGLITANDPTLFSSAEFISNGEKCSNNEANPFAFRCHPELKVTLFKKGTNEAVTADLKFSSLWSTRHIHETAFTTWTEYEVMLGAIGANEKYFFTRFIIDYPTCNKL